MSPIAAVAALVLAPILINILFLNPRSKVLQITIVSGCSHPLARGVTSEVMGVDGLVSRGGMTELGHLFGGEGGVPNALDFVVEFSAGGSNQNIEDGILQCGMMLAQVTAV